MIYLRRWILCLGLGAPFGQTHSSERDALGLFRQLLAMDVEDAEGLGWWRGR